MGFIENYIGVNHFVIVVYLLAIIKFINDLFNKIEFKNIIISLILIELVVFYTYLLVSGRFDYKMNLPLEMCYLTQISILFYFLFDLKSIRPLLFFNAISGAIAGYLNTNMTANDPFVYHFHHYLAHSILLIFFLYLLHQKYRPTMRDFTRSILLNYIIFVSVIIFNKLFVTNYWFTVEKPQGVNLTLLFPEWPGYLIVIISIGLIVYTITYMLCAADEEFE